MWVCAGLSGSAALSQSVPAKTEDRPKIVLFPEFGITCLGLVFVFTDSRPLFLVCVIIKINKNMLLRETILPSICLRSHTKTLPISLVKPGSHWSLSSVHSLSVLD